MSTQDWIDIGLGLLTFVSLVLHRLHSAKAQSFAKDLDAVKAVLPVGTK